MEPDTLSRGGETAAGLQSKDNRGEKGEWGKKGGKERAKRTRREERERVEREKGKRGQGGSKKKKKEDEGEGKRKERNKGRGGGGRIGSRTESFGLACLACYDGISEMVEPRHRHKKRLTMQKTLHPVAARSSTARLSAPA